MPSSPSPFYVLLCKEGKKHPVSPLDIFSIRNECAQMTYKLVGSSRSLFCCNTAVVCRNITKNTGSSKKRMAIF